MKILEFFYKSWYVIIITSTVVGLLALFVPFNKLINSEGSSKLIKSLKYLVAIIAGILITFSGIIYSLFTEVPNVTGINVSNAIKCLRENDLEGECLPNLKYDNLYLNYEVNFQSVDKGKIVLKGTTVYINFVQDVRTFENIINNSNTDLEDDITQSPVTDPSANQGLNNQNEKRAIVPDVVGMEQGDAISALYMAGLQFQVYWHNNDESQDNKYFVIAQSYEYGDSVDLGTIVKLELSHVLPDSINLKSFTYEQDDSLVKSTSELNGFYMYSQSVTIGSYYNAVTDEVSYPDYLPEKLCQVYLNVSGADDAILSIYMEGANTGICINSHEKTGFFINKGSYVINADFGNTIKTAYIYIDSSGEYAVNFM